MSRQLLLSLLSLLLMCSNKNRLLQRRWRWSKLIAATMTSCYLMILSTLVALMLLLLLLNTRHHHRDSYGLEIDDEDDESINKRAEQTAIVYWHPSYGSRKQLGDRSNDSNDRIFFHETSGRMELSFRQNCAVESAALHNPQRPVQIFFQPQQQSTTTTTSSIDQSSAWFRAVSHYDNVQLIVIDDEELYFKDSPLEDWYRRGEWRNSKWRIQHMADYIRMVTLKRGGGGGGGMYLDLDIITLKPYDGLLFRNFVTAKIENFERITNAVFHLDGGHRLIDAIIKKQSDGYDPEDYAFNGPGAVTKVMADLCFKGDANVCTDVRLLLPHFFHPEGTTSDDNKNVLLHDIFQRTNEPGVEQFLRQIRATSYGVHFHNFYSKDSAIDTTTPNSTQVFAILAAEHCPLSFAAARQQQGPNQLQDS